jgi:hypothetical protein
MLKAGSSKTPTWSKAKSKPENPLPSSLSRSKDSEDSDNDDKVPVKVFIQDCGAYKHKNTCIVSLHIIFIGKKYKIQPIKSINFELCNLLSSGDVVYKER